MVSSILYIYDVTVHLISSKYGPLLYALRSLKFAPFTFRLSPFAFILSAAVRNLTLCSLRSALCALRLLPFTLILFAFCLLPAFAFAAQVTLAWDRNTENDIAGYRLYYGTSSRNYTTRIDAGNTDQYTVTGLSAGVSYYFAATAYDVDDNESAFSEQVVHTIPLITHTITVLAGDNGSITPAGPVTVNEGTNQTFSIHPDENYQVLNVKVDGVSLGTVSSYTFRNILDDHTIEALFVQADPPPPADQDSDGDGVPDDRDQFPLDPNETIDTDGDGIGNNADADDDNDGMPDDWEIMHNLNPLQNDASADPDGDGISNLQEYLGGSDPQVFEEFSKPEPPVLMSPSNDEIVSLTPVLQTEAFYDPDVNDVHAATRWQIFRDEDQVCVFDKVSQLSLTTLRLPKLILEENTAYVWKVSFTDSHGIESEWSESGRFITDLNVADANGNGIPDHEEVNATIDLDEDGTPDNDQNDIKSVNVEGESTQIGISIRDSDNVQSIAAVETENPIDHQPPVLALDRQINFPYGLISFKLIVENPGDVVVVALHLSQAAPQNGIWYKYDPVEDVWYDYSAYTEFSATRKSVYLTLTDGGFGDADGTVNGIIVDPLGLGVTASAESAEALAGGGGGGGGCFISASAGTIKTIGPAAIRQNLSVLALVLTLLSAIFILARCLEKLISHRVR